MWFLFQDILTFTGNNFNPQLYYPLFQSMIKMFYLFKVQVQFDGDELSEFWIQCTFCQNNVHCHISDIKHSNFTKKKILPVFIKDLIFNHVGL